VAGPPPAVAAVRVAVRADLCDLPAGSLVLVACSGGPDSLALAAGLAFVAPRVGMRGGAVTVDHAWYPGSADRAEEVARMCRDLGLAPVEVRRAAAARTEGAARTARRAALEAAAEDLGAAAVLLAHTRDDQAETVLLRLARGSGARSLAGMPRRDGPYRRPLLSLPRESTRQACKEAGLVPWDDPSNLDPAFARGRVRSALLPALERELGPGVVAALARSADLLRADADALDALTPDLVQLDADGSLYLPVHELQALPAALRTRALRAAAIAAGSPATDLTAAHVAHLDELITRWHGQGPLHLPGLVAALRTDGRIVLVHGTAR
jgi:tRNA(Ile)-lysidine synthetase-like protein